MRGFLLPKIKFVNHLYDIGELLFIYLFVVDSKAISNLKLESLKLIRDY